MPQMGTSYLSKLYLHVCSMARYSFVCFDIRYHAIPSPIHSGGEVQVNTMLLNPRSQMA